MIGRKTFLIPAALALSMTLAFAAPVKEWFEGVPAKDHAHVNPMASQPKAASAGALLYGDHCLSCHRANAQGDGKKKPSLRNGRIGIVSDGDLEWFLRQGNLHKGMPSWSSLPEAQRWQLVAYPRSIQ
jgi:mono/diheme cytochrome c family protein